MELKTKIAGKGNGDILDQWTRLSSQIIRIDESSAAVLNVFSTKDQFPGRQFFHAWRRGRGGWDDSSALPLLYTLFLLLLHRLHLRSSGIRSQSLGTPAVYCSLWGAGKAHPASKVFSLCHSVWNSVLRIPLDHKEPLGGNQYSWEVYKHLFPNHPHLPQGVSQ